MQHLTQSTADQMLPTVLRYITPTPKALSQFVWLDPNEHSSWALLIQILEWSPRLRYIARARRTCLALLRFSLMEWPSLQMVLHRGGERVALLATLLYPTMDGSEFPSHPTFWTSPICNMTGFPHPNPTVFNAVLSQVAALHGDASSSVAGAHIQYTRSILYLHSIQEMLLLPGGRDMYLDSADNVSSLMKIFWCSLRCRPTLLVPFLKGQMLNTWQRQLSHMLLTGPDCTSTNPISRNIETAVIKCRV